MGAILRDGSPVADASGFGGVSQTIACVSTKFSQRERLSPLPPSPVISAGYRSG